MKLPSLIVLCALAACAPEGGRRDAAARADTLHAAPPRSASRYPARVPPGWDRARLPPPGRLVRAGACPFECCIYGEWWSDSATVVHHAPRDTSDTAFVLPARTPVTATTGTLYVASLARIVFDAPMGPDQIGARDLSFTPADTLYLVQPVGEGAFIVWQRGREFELPPDWEYLPDSKARREGAYAGHWWARLQTRDGRSGWVWMDRTRAPMWGADACGGPHPLE